MKSGRSEKAETFLQHLEPLQGALESYCRRSLRNRSDVSDVLQSAVANAFRDFHLYVAGTNFRAWIFRYVTFEILNCNRKYRRTRQTELTSQVSIEETWQLILDEPLFQKLLDDPDVVLDQCDAAVAEAVWGLAPLEQSVFLLRAIGDFKYREIADILQVPVGTVMSALSRGRLRLRRQLVKYGEAEGFLQREAAE